MSKRGRKDKDVEREIGEIEKDLKKKVPFPQPERIRWQKGGKKFSKTAKQTSELTEKVDRKAGLEGGKEQERVISEDESLIPAWSSKEKEEYKYRLHLMTYGLFGIVKDCISTEEMEMVMARLSHDSNKEIAERKGVTVRRIRQKFDEIFEKLGKSEKLRKVPNIKAILIEVVGGKRRFDKLFSNWPGISI